jgi:adenosylcobinamide kinase/adenosylcobinamide-phosphate guanylyltransferase
VTGRNVLVLGGARSGKSRYAEAIAAGHEGQKVYVATAEPGDAEMAARIAHHKARRDAGWTTIEAPLDIAPALETHSASFVLVDCITLWLTNMLLARRDIAPEVERLASVLSRRHGPTVLVSNEVGFGIVPDNELARRFRDEAGLAHQRLAKICDEVVLMVAGLPMKFK